MPRLFLLALLVACSAYGGDPLRVMSFNVRYGTASDGENHWDKRKDLCVSRIAAFKPDILGLQEALNFQNEYVLKGNPRFKALGVAREDGKEKGEYTTLLYNTERFEALDSGTFWLSETPDVAGSKSWDSSLPRIATWARLKEKGSGRELFALNTHFDHRGQQARVEAAKLIRRFVSEKAKDLPVIVTGDFNSAPDSAAHKALIAKEDARVDLADTYAVFFKDKPEPNSGTAHAFKGDPVTPRIDWILATNHFTTQLAAIDRHREANLFPSDHYAVTAVLNWK